MTLAAYLSFVLVLVLLLWRPHGVLPSRRHEALA